MYNLIPTTSEPENQTQRQGHAFIIRVLFALLYQLRVKENNNPGYSFAPIAVSTALTTCILCQASSKQ